LQEFHNLGATAAKITDYILRSKDKGQDDNKTKQGKKSACEHDNLKTTLLNTARRNFAKFTTSVQLGTKMNGIEFEVKRS